MHLFIAFWTHKPITDIFIFSYILCSCIGAKTNVRITCANRIKETMKLRTIRLVMNDYLQRSEIIWNLMVGNVFTYPFNNIRVNKEHVPF